MKANKYIIVCILALTLFLNLFYFPDLELIQTADTDTSISASELPVRKTRWLLFTLIGLGTAFVVSRIVGRKGK